MPARAVATHTFTLIVEGPVDDDSVLDALFDAGCDDATFGSVDGIGFADFQRDARSFLEAVRSAIRAVGSVPQLRVVRIEPEDLVTVAEIARRLGRSREGVRLLITGARGPGGFPAPIARIRSRSPMWRWTDVARWAEGAIGHADEHADLVAAVNTALELRRQRATLAAKERAFVASLAG
ncbi:MAG: helix-turn-helix transcriptional regulator [Myxococcota bacterium]